MELEKRVEALEATVAALQRQQESVTQRPDGGVTDDEPWLVQRLADLPAPGGAIGYGGTVTLPDDEHYEWQWVRPTDAVLDIDPSVAAGRLDALGSPVRLRILQAVLNGTHGTAELGAIPGLGTSGQLHHHLRTLTAAGWLVSTARGRYTVPPQRVVPLLATILATGE